MNAQPSQRRVLFHSGRIVRRKDPRPCRQGSHVGPLLDCELFDAHEDALWHGIGTCGCCGSTVSRDQLRRAA
jgi:hypothetical protein